MAHLEKYKNGAVSAMVKHYERKPELGGFERPNIDNSRISENYTVGTDIDIEDTIKSCIEQHNEDGRSIRADAVTLADWVITAPADLPPEQHKQLFQAVHDFVADRYSNCVVPQGFVHMDETSPHMHQPLIPFDKDTGRFQASKIINRQDLKSFHGELEKYCCERLGVAYLGLELSQEAKQEKAAEYVSLPEYQAAKDQVREVNERLERLRPVREILDEERPKLGALSVSKSEYRAIENREKELVGEVEKLRERISEVEQQNQGLRGRISNLRGAITAKAERLAEQVQRAVKDLPGLGERIEQLKEQNRELGERIGSLQMAIGRAVGRLHSQDEQLHTQDEHQKWRF